MLSKLNHSLAVAVLTLATSSACLAQDASALAPGSGVARMQNLMDAIANKKAMPLTEDESRAVATGKTSAAAVASPQRLDTKTVEFAMAQSADWLTKAREAYVAALPPKDRALGRSVLLGDRTEGVGNGQLLIFVSRSMPEGLLRAYAVDAFYLNAKLVVKGIRKGETLHDYVTDVMDTYNTAEGMSMAEIAINPNLFDMYDVKVVPSIVWTTRVGLDDVGSGCQDVADGTPVAKLRLEGPDEQVFSVDKPVCAKEPETSYLKVAGTLAMPYVLDRFREAGMPKAAAQEYSNRLAVRTANVFQGEVRQDPGSRVTPLSEGFKLDLLPRAVALGLKSQLDADNVQRGPYGPTFNPDEADDARYRAELSEKIRRSLVH